MLSVNFTAIEGIPLIKQGDDLAELIVKALDAHRGWDLMWMPRMAGWTGSFDRLLAAQALEEDLTVVSADRVFRKYGVALVW